jgi:hypothetical protein
MSDKPITFSGAHKLLALALSIGTAVMSAGTSYVIFRTGTSYQLEDHERRINKLEGRADNNDKTVNEINSKLDVAVAILQRIDREQQRVGTK